jgi:hypothetical protein
MRRDSFSSKSAKQTYEKIFDFEFNRNRIDCVGPDRVQSRQRVSYLRWPRIPTVQALLL